MPPLFSIDSSALARLGGIGLALALLLLAGLWWRRSLARRPLAVRRAALGALTLFLCFDLVVFGAYTRLSDSGLGCPDWPGCYGQASPVGAAPPIAQAQSVQPDGPVTERKAWIEMIHRYLAMAVGVLIVSTLVLAWRARVEEPGAWKLPLLSLAWVMLQGVFGGLTVTWKLYPAVVTAHLLGGMGLLALLTLQYRTRQYRAKPAPRMPPEPNAPRAVDRALWATAVVVLGLQIALGGWVSTNEAVLACTGFPQCNGHLWPPMQWARGFEIFRPLGQAADGTPIGLGALVAIHWTHRLFALAAAAALSALAVRLWRHGAAGRRAALAVAGLLALQVATGISNVVFGGPLPAALAHTAGAAALVVCLVGCLGALAATSRASHPQEPLHG